jgi:hypothetical protein
MRDKIFIDSNINQNLLLIQIAPIIRGIDKDNKELCTLDLGLRT